ncbi:MAG: NAD(P)/FAD-dependent oxidoreductase, partial [Gemmatimonadaceae bacterium]
DEWYGRGVYDRVVDPTLFQSQKIVIIGGGDSACDWAHQLRDVATEITLVHRSDRFRAHASTVAEVVAACPPAGRTTLLPFHELQEILAEGDRLRGVRVRDVKEKTTRDIEADSVLPMLGFHSELGALKDWGLTFEGNDIAVNSRMETGRTGVWAAGDITTYPGKLKLIATGFGEAAAAVNQAVHWIYPEKKVAPGHSSNMAIFGQKDD